MNVLFVITHFHPDTSASANLSRKLIEELIRLDNSVDVISMKTSIKTLPTESISDIRITRVLDYTKLDIKQLMIEMCEVKGSTIKNNLVSISKTIYYKIITKLINYLRKDNINLYRTNLFRKAIEQSMVLKDYDAIVTVSSDFSSSYALATLKKKKQNIKFILYQVDPYSNNYVLKMKYKPKREKTEAFIYSKADRVITTPSIFSDYENSVNSMYLKKFKVLEFPKIIKPEIIRVKDDIHLSDDTINIVYTGLLYSDIRSPEYFFKCMDQLKDEKITIYLIGGEVPSEYKKYLSLFNEKVIIMNRVSMQSTTNVLLKADILINIGNSITNTTPSKIFEYFSTGRPIINFYKSGNCPTLSYTKMYPECIDIFEDDTKLEENIQNISKFIKKGSRKIPFNQIKEIYNKCTIEYVGYNFLDIINEIK